jgi:hypothetical protein
MLVPACVYKNHIEQKFKRIQYSDKYLWYTGSIDNYDMEVNTGRDKFAFAIIFQEAVIGYVSFRVDWYCSMAYNFSLIKFKDTVEYFYGDSPDEYRLISTTMIMASAIREVMRMVESFNLHRIDFRCVDGNPAEEKYDKIVDKILDKGVYDCNILTFKDNIKDTHGSYHDTIVYELIRKYYGE